MTSHDIPVSSVTLFMSGYFKMESWYCDQPGHTCEFSDFGHVGIFPDRELVL